MMKKGENVKIKREINIDCIIMYLEEATQPLEKWLDPFLWFPNMKDVIKGHHQISVEGLQKELLCILKVNA